MKGIIFVLMLITLVILCVLGYQFLMAEAAHIGFDKDKAQLIYWLSVALVIFRIVIEAD